MAVGLAVGGGGARLCCRAIRGAAIRGRDRAVAAGLPAVIACPSTETRNTWHTPAGNVVLVCPAQRRDTSCSDCMLCHQGGRGRRVIVAFIAHGVGKRKADAAITAQREREVIA